MANSSLGQTWTQSPQLLQRSELILTRLFIAFASSKFYERLAALFQPRLRYRLTGINSGCHWSPTFSAHSGITPLVTHGISLCRTRACISTSDLFQSSSVVHSIRFELLIQPWTFR